MDSQKWSISRGLGSFQVHLSRTSPLWDLAEEAFNYVVDVTGHRVCCNIPDVLWDTPLSEELDEDGKPVKSVGSLINDFTSQVEMYIWDKRQDVLSVDINVEQAAKLDPEFVAIFEED